MPGSCTSQTTTAGAPELMCGARALDAGEGLDLEAGQVQRLGRAQAHVFVVLDQQHPDGSGFAHWSLFELMDGCRERQLDDEAGAALPPVGGAQRAVHGAHQLCRDHQAQAQARRPRACW